MKEKIAAASVKNPIEILLVEDNPGDVTLMRELLKLSKFPTRLGVAQDGEQAMAYLRREGPFASVGRPDFILLDLNLPKKNGHEVLAEIRRSSRLSGIPVLILTTSNQDDDKWQAYHCRADSYLVKPRELSQFKALVKYLEENWFKEVSLDGFRV